jgi:hypothetical protein
VAFHIIASTGRTATTFLAAALDTIEGVTACHEGYAGADKAGEPLLPLINLENNLAYQSPAQAVGIVASKRGPEVLEGAAARAGCSVLVDVAYYNPTIASSVLDLHPACRMIGLIRDCASFVRSATQMEGEDLLPVGWPNQAKPLTDREKFIGFGRIRPRRGSDDAARWKEWSAIERNIWLWRETNLLLLDARDRFPDRVRLIDFAMLKSGPTQFWADVVSHFGLSHLPEISSKLTMGYINTKATGYQVGPAPEWSDRERSFLAEAETTIANRWGNDG